MKLLFKQKLALAALLALVISGLSFAVTPAQAIESVVAPVSPVIVSIITETITTPQVHVVGPAFTQQACALPSSNSQTLVQDPAAINLNQPLNCFSLSIKPSAVNYTFNTEVVRSMSFGHIIVVPSHYNIATPQFHKPAQTAWTLPSLLPSPALLRLSLLYILYALLLSAALFATALLINQKQTSLAQLCVRRC